MNRKEKIELLKISGINSKNIILKELEKENDEIKNGLKENKYYAFNNELCMIEKISQDEVKLKFSLFKYATISKEEAINNLIKIEVNHTLFTPVRELSDDEKKDLVISILNNVLEYIYDNQEKDIISKSGFRCNKSEMIYYLDGNDYCPLNDFETLYEEIMSGKNIIKIINNAKWSFDEKKGEDVEILRIMEDVYDIMFIFD